MRAISFAAAVIILAVPSGAYAQGRSSATLTVSVRVVRNCVVTPLNPVAPSFTTQCSGTAQPRADVSNTMSAPATAPAPMTRLDSDSTGAASDSTGTSSDNTGSTVALTGTTVEASDAAIPESDGSGFRVLTVNF